MNIKAKVIKITYILIAVLLMTVVYASQPIQPTEEQTIDIFAEKYQVIQSNPKCQGWCNATLKAGDYQIELHYNIVDGEVEQIDEVHAFIHGEEVKNIYIDRFEYSKISSAMSNSI